MNKIVTHVEGRARALDDYSREDLVTALKVCSLRLQIVEAALAQEKNNCEAQSALLTKLLSQPAMRHEKGNAEWSGNGVRRQEAVDQTGICLTGCTPRRIWSNLGSKLRRELNWRRDAKLLDKSNLFDRDWYLAQNVDVKNAKCEPSRHFLLYGGIEGRDPSRSFSSKLYLAHYQDVTMAGLNPLVHYLRYGLLEGRKSFPVEQS